MGIDDQEMTVEQYQEYERRKREVVQGALDKVNEIRSLCGWATLPDLPKGMQDEATMCPIANAFEDLPISMVGVGGDFFDFSDSWDPDNLSEDETKFLDVLSRVFPQGIWDPVGGTFTFNNGREIRDFVSMFDEGNIPEYELEYDEMEREVYG